MDGRKLMCQFQGFPAPNPLVRRELRGLAISTKQLWCASASCKQHPCKSPARQPWCKGPALASSHYFCLQIATNFTEFTFWVEAVIPKETIAVVFLCYICTLYNSDCYLWGLSGKLSTVLSLLGLEVIRVRVHLYFWSLAPQCPRGWELCCGRTET